MAGLTEGNAMSLLALPRDRKALVPGTGRVSYTRTDETTGEKERLAGDKLADGLTMAAVASAFERSSEVSYAGAIHSGSKASKAGTRQQDQAG